MRARCEAAPGAAPSAAGPLATPDRAGRRRQLVGKEFPIEAKVFFFELGENPRGRFLRISESGAG